MYQQDLAWFKAMLAEQQLIDKLKHISLVITDVDGTLTDGNVIISDHEEDELKGISMQDDFIISRALEQGIGLAIITGRRNIAFKKYITELGVPESLYFEGIDKDKFKAAVKIKEQLGLSRDDMLMFGDEFLDFEVRNYVSLYAVPLNTPFYLHPQADIVTPHAGGNGALRILLDLLLYVQGKHFAQKYIDELVRT